MISHEGCWGHIVILVGVTTFCTLAVSLLISRGSPADLEKGFSSRNFYAMSWQFMLWIFAFILQAALLGKNMVG
jgi:hypothetical protein